MATIHKSAGQYANASRHRMTSQAVTEPAAAPVSWPTRWAKSTLGPALVGALLAFAAQPPLGWWPLAWVAPVPWVLLARRERLPGRRPYVELWLAGAAYWLLAVHWLRLPHWAAHFGWLALAAYLGVYLPVFVGLTRVAVHRLRVSCIVAAPVVWMGLELAQAHLLSGFNMASLGQTQFRWLGVIQIADLAGGYAVSGLVMLVAACIARALPSEQRRASLWPALPATAALAAALAYGHTRMNEAALRPGPVITLVQGSVDTTMKHDPTEQQQVQEQYQAKSREARDARPDTDLIVWPETMFRVPLLTFAEDAAPALNDIWTLEDAKSRAADCRWEIDRTSKDMQAPLLLGIDTIRFGPGKADHFNSAIFIDRDGRLGERYDKTHLVMFGEYVPGAKTFPWLYSLTPLGGGVERGTEPKALRIGKASVEASAKRVEGRSFIVSPSICYETVLSHVIRGQVSTLAARGEEPDVLVNLTNDGWFWGSSELDQHLVCAVFRAVECRKPLVIAANTGFSAWIDGDGRIKEQGPRRDEGFIVASVELDSRRSLYLAHGDWLAGLSLACCVILAAVGVFPRRERPSASVP